MSGFSASTGTDDTHLGFDNGIHHCCGAPLARIESRIALQAFLERIERPRLVADPPSYRPSPPCADPTSSSSRSTEFVPPPLGPRPPAAPDDADEHHGQGSGTPKGSPALLVLFTVVLIPTFLFGYAIGAGPAALVRGFVAPFSLIAFFGGPCELICAWPQP